MTSHLDDGTIQELLDGEIHSSELPPIQSHLAACVECRARLETARGFMAEADGLIELLDEPAISTPPIVLPLSKPRPVSWQRRLAWAASVVMAVGAGWYSRGEVLGRPGGESLVVSREKEPVVATVPEASVDATPSQAREGEREVAPSVAAKREARVDEVVKPSVVAPASEAVNSAELMRGSGAGSALGAVAAAPPAVARAEAQANRARQLERPSGLVPRDQVVTKQLMDAPAPQEISFSDAVRLLDGTLKLIDGMVPSRLESLGSTVRVIYPVSQGELVLAQSVTNGVWTIRLTGPASFPADSLATLRGKVRDE